MNRRTVVLAAGVAALVVAAALSAYALHGHARPAAAPFVAGSTGTTGSGGGDAPDTPRTAVGDVIVGTANMHAALPSLRAIRPLPGRSGPVVPMNELDQAGTPGSPVLDAALQTSVTAPAAPATTVNFEGVGNLDSVYPPDTNGDVGPTQYVQIINLHFAIFDKTGSIAYGPAANNTLWSALGGPCATQNSGDPVVLYDQLAGRWVMSQFTSRAPYGECVAVSKTSDATGAWNLYFFLLSRIVFYDYPHFGIWPDGYYVTFNRFKGNYRGPSVVAINRDDLVNGVASARFQEVQRSASFGTLQPADLDGTTLPPAGSTEPVLGRSGTTGLNLFKFHVDWANAASSTFSGPTTIPVAAYNQLCAGTRSCVPQPGTTVGLDGLGDRLMYRVALRMIGGNDATIVNHSVDVGSGSTQAAVRWYELRDLLSGTPSVAQQGTYAPSSTSRWMGSAAMDKLGNVAVQYTVSDGTSTFPGIRYALHASTDPAGTLGTESTLISGGGVQTGTASRWGDYSETTVDPVDDCTFWFTNEYMPTTGPAPWHTRIGAFKGPGC